MSLINTENQAIQGDRISQRQVRARDKRTLKGKCRCSCSTPPFHLRMSDRARRSSDNYANSRNWAWKVYGVSTDTHFAHKACTTPRTHQEGAVPAGRRSDAQRSRAISKC